MRVTVRNQARRLVMLVTALLAAGVLVAGCGISRGQVGAAALVGDREIPIDVVQHQVRSAVAGAPQRLNSGALDELTRGVLTLQVRQALLRQSARRESLTVSAGQVTRFIRRVGGVQALADTREQARRRARTLLLQRELGHAVLPDLAVTVSYITEPNRRAAKRRARQLAQAGRQQARRIIQNRIEQGAAGALDRRIVAARNPGIATTARFAVPAGTVVAFPSQRRLGTWLVMVVTRRSTNAQAGEVDVGQLPPRLLRAIGIRTLSFIGVQQGVRINPRYGAWDPVHARVVPKANQVGGFVIPMSQQRAA